MFRAIALALLLAPIAADAGGPTPPLNELELLGMMERDGYAVAATRDVGHHLVIEATRDDRLVIVEADLRTGSISIREISD